MDYNEISHNAVLTIAKGFFQWSSNNLSPKNLEILQEVEQNSLILFFRILILHYFEEYDNSNQNVGIIQIKNDVKKYIKDPIPFQDTSFKNAFWTRLKKIFKKIHKNIYEEGLYNPELYPKLEEWVISDEILIKIIHNLEKIPVKIRINTISLIYEQLLDYGLKYSEESKGEELKFASDVQKKKSRGTYYTPKHIIKYIIKNTLGPIIKKRIKEAGSKAIDRLEAILSIKVLDPAMGGGFFLMEAFNFLVKNASEALLSDLEGNTDETIPQPINLNNLRTKILENCIFGIDSDELAIEIAKISLNLQITEGKKRLEYLHDHVKQGNSLLLDWDNEFPEVFSRENPGFEVVLGNPPYIDSEEMCISQPKLREYCNKNFKTARGNWDLYIVFIELAINLANQEGRVSQIVPNKLLAAEYAAEIRRKMLEYTLTTIRDYSGVKVFNIDVYPIIYNLIKLKPQDKNQIKVEIVEDNQGDLEIIYENTINYEILKNLPGNTFSAIFNCNFNLIAKILNTSKRFADFFTIKGGASVSEAYEIKKYLMDRGFKEPFNNEFKLVNSGTIFSYSNRWGIEPTKYIKEKYRAPIIKKEDLKMISKKRVEQSMGSKIIISGMCRLIEAMLDEREGYLAGKSTVIVYQPKNSQLNLLEFATGLINSKLISFIYKSLFKSLSLQGGYMRVGPPQIKQLPFLVPEEQICNEIVKRVVQVSDLLKKLNSEIKSFLSWISKEWNCNIDNLSLKTYLWRYWKYEFDEIIRLAKKNKHDINELIHNRWKKSKEKVSDLRKEIEMLKMEINMKIFSLYNLDKTEIITIDKALKNQ